MSTVSQWQRTGPDTNCRANDDQDEGAVEWGGGGGVQSAYKGGDNTITQISTVFPPYSTKNAV